VKSGHASFRTIGPHQPGRLALRALAAGYSLVANVEWIFGHRGRDAVVPSVRALILF
jgi:hypothetical protein